ncbi:MAG: hypothetical protein Q7S33_01355 [Nanoarchaeota archaeon]|nr:hypothetical protein [Nanoarchaeota archaeon]
MGLKQIKAQFSQGKSIELILKNDFPDTMLYVVRACDEELDEEYTHDVFFSKKEAEECMEGISKISRNLFYTLEATLKEIETKYSFDGVDKILLYHRIEEKLRRD